MPVRQSTEPRGTRIIPASPRAWFVLSCATHGLWRLAARGSRAKLRLHVALADEAAPIWLDNQPMLAATKGDAVAFIRGLDRAIIDEVRRAPEMLLALKASADEDARAALAY